MSQSRLKSQRSQDRTTDKDDLVQPGIIQLVWHPDQQLAPARLGVAVVTRAARQGAACGPIIRVPRLGAGLNVLCSAAGRRFECKQTPILSRVRECVFGLTQPHPCALNPP